MSTISQTIGEELDRQARRDREYLPSGESLTSWPMKRTPICAACNKFIYPAGSDCPCGEQQKGKSAA